MELERMITAPEIKSAVQLALHFVPETTVSYQSNDAASIAEGPPVRDNPQFRKLVEGIIFSRKLILNYQAVLLCLLLGFTISHWSIEYTRWRRLRALKRHTIVMDRLKHSPGSKGVDVVVQDMGDKKGFVSSSDSLSSMVMPGSQEDEQTPLLRHRETTSKPRRAAGLSAKFGSFLMYQPKPVSIVGKVLPSNATSITVILLVGINAFFTSYRVPFTVPMLFVFADRTSLVFVANLPWLYLFAAKNQPIKFLTGYSYESLNILHRRLGEIMCLMALLHSAGMIGVWYTLLQPLGISLLHFLLEKIIILGIGAFVAYEALYFTSLGSFRQRWYELFLGLHVSLQIFALILLFLHHHGSRVYVGIALGIFVIDRLVYRLILKTNTSSTLLSVASDQQTILLHTSLPLKPDRPLISRLLFSNTTTPWNATDHVFLTIPALSNLHKFQAHPFTIASRAPSPDDSIGTLDLIIRARDGFSRDLLHYAHSHTSATIRLDGPYGSHDAAKMLFASDLCVLIAGGSGIAVTYPLVCALLHAQKSTDAESNTDSCSTQKQRILFVWVTQKASHAEWLGVEKLRGLYSQGVDFRMPPPTEEGQRPDLKQMVEEWVGQWHAEMKIGVVVSGPDEMGRAVRNVAAGLVGEGRDVGVSVEKFGW